MYVKILTLLAIVGMLNIAQAAEPKTEDFERADLGKQWNINFGSWKIQDGVLECQEQKVDEHAAAARWKVPFTDAEITLRVKLNEAKAFHIGTDPAPKQLDKKGHLYSLILTGKTAVLKSHKNKADANSKDSVVARAQHNFSADEWITIKLKSVGNTVQAELKEGNQQIQLQGTHVEFSVKKPAIVFRTAKGPAYVDDIVIEVLK